MALPLAIPIIALAASLASGIYGAVTGNKRRKEALAIQEEKKRKLDAWRDRELNADYIDRADSQAMLRKIREYNKDALAAYNNNAIKGGASEEARVAAAGQLNKNYASAISQIAGIGAQHKDRVQNMYMTAGANLDDLKISTLMDNTGMQNMVNGVNGAANAALQLYGMGGTGGGTAGELPDINNLPGSTPKPLYT